MKHRGAERRRLEMRSWFAVVRAYHECARRYSQLLRPLELTTAQFDLLSAVHELGAGATPAAIASRLVVTRGNVTGLLHRLQDKGLLVTRESERDGRSFLCLLTPAGEALLLRARRLAERFIAEQLAPFHEAELEATQHTMERMRAHLQTLDPDSLHQQVFGLEELDE